MMRTLPSPNTSRSPSSLSAVWLALNGLAGCAKVARSIQSHGALRVEIAFQTFQIRAEIEGALVSHVTFFLECLGDNVL